MFMFQAYRFIFTLFLFLELNPFGILGCSYAKSRLPFGALCAALTLRFEQPKMPKGLALRKKKFVFSRSSTFSREGANE